MTTTVLFAGGGSGGHIYPGLAIAERLAAIDPGGRAIFACSTRGIDDRILAGSGFEYHALPAAPISIRPRALARFVGGYRDARRAAGELIRERDVAVVLALGGFVAAPVVAAARAAGVPTVLLNLDARPGKANRWLARRCGTVATAVPLPGHPRFSRVLGMPVRRQAVAGEDRAASRAALGLAEDRKTLLVVGGSQGASSLNRFAIALAEAHGEALRSWQILHLAGNERDEVAAGYEKVGVHAIEEVGVHAIDAIAAGHEKVGVHAIVLDFLDGMGLAWGAADLALTRCGAGSVAEVAVNAVPAVFLPYPFHHDEHQRHNAEPLARLGGAVIVRDHVDPAANLADGGSIVISLLADADRRHAMAEKLATHRPDDAAEAAARLLLRRSNKTSLLAETASR